MTFDRDNARVLIARVKAYPSDVMQWDEPGLAGDVIAELTSALESALSAVPVEGDREALQEQIGSILSTAAKLLDGAGRSDAAESLLTLPALIAGLPPLPVGGEVERRCSFSLDQGCLCDLPNGHTGLHECQRHRFSDRPMFGEVAP